MTTTQRCTIVPASFAVMLLCVATAGAASNSLMIPAAAFSADGTNQAAYINYGDSIETGTTLHFHAWVKLPNASTITNVDMMTLDADAGTITGYLKRTKFGFDSAAETLLTFTSPGGIGCSASGLCHDMESLLDIKVDASNYGYWFEVIVPDAAGTPPTENDLSFYAVRIMYDHDDLIFADTFESSDTVMWSSLAAGKSGVIVAEPSRHAEATGLAEPAAAERLAWLSSLQIADPLARDAMEKALLGTASYGSPYVIPGPAFKTAGYTDYDAYYFSETYGFVYGRPGEDDGAVLIAPVNLPDDAQISYYFAFFVDSVRTGTQADIRFWLTRMDATDIIPTDNMVYEVSSGRNTAIQAISVSGSAIDSAVPGSRVIDNSKYSYWATIDVGPYDLSPPDPYSAEDWWHKVYAIVILYTMP